MDYFQGFSNAMDRSYYHQLDSFGDVYHPVALHDEHPKTTLGPRELGMSNNPFQSQLIALQAKIREGASSIEFQFPGRAKGNSQASTPESYGYEEREAMRQLAEYNDVKTSTHATFSVSGLAGWGQNGFDKQAQHQNMEEVRRAVHFAAEASTGGAIVVHTGEWHRPMSEAPWAKEFGEIEVWDPNTKQKKKVPGYMSYPDEHNQAALQVVDATGNVIGGIRKDWGAYAPKWMTKKDFVARTSQKLSYKDFYGKPVDHYEDDDLVDLNGNLINPTDLKQLEARVPLWNEHESKFEIENLKWEELQQRADRYNKRWGTNYTPEELHARAQLDAQILQARGNSQYHARHYNEAIKKLRKFEKAYEFVNELDKSLPENEKWRLLRTMGGIPDFYIPPETVDIRKAIQDEIESAQRDLRYIQEAASSSDLQAEQIQRRYKDIQSLEKYGLKETGRALGELGVYAMDKSKYMKERVREKGGDTKKYEDLYIAPENVFPAEYGSHPDELIKIVEEGRKAMANQLLALNRAKNPQEAEELAKKHIKSTIDIGHLNMWKTHMVRKPGENDDQFNKRFEKWMLGKLETMHKKGVLGHFHLTDNMGFNDEHLTPGQGNAPVRSFMKFLEENGYRDFIIEPGSFNAGTAMAESWAYLGALGTRPGVYGAPQHFNRVHLHQSGSYMPALFMYGSYVPSNEFTFWSQVPLE